MSALLTKWLNSELNMNIKSVEEDFSNGFRFGELLYSCGYESSFEEYKNSTSNVEVANNFDLLTLALAKLGIVLQKKTIKRIRQKVRGASSKVLLDLKLAFEEKKKICAPSKPKKNVTASIRPPNGRRYIQKEDSFDEVFYNETNKNLTSKTMTEAIHLKKFKEKQWKAEKANLQQNNNLKESLYQEKKKRMDIQQELFRKKRSFLTEWMKDGVENWKKNQKSFLDKEGQELRFELSMRERRILNEKVKQIEASIDQYEGVNFFENNIKRLGISNADGPIRLEPIFGSNADYMKLLTEQVNACNFNPSKNQSMMHELKSRRRAHIYAQKERDRRRRKMVVDQHHATVETNRKREETQLLQRLLNNGTEIRNQLKLERIEKYRRKIQGIEKLDNIHRSISESRIRNEEAILSSIPKLLELSRLRRIEKLDEMTQINQDIVALKQESNNKHHLIASDILSEIIGFTFKVIDVRENNNNKLLSPRTYNELKHVSFSSKNIWNHKGTEVGSQSSDKIATMKEYLLLKQLEVGKDIFENDMIGDSVISDLNKEINDTILKLKNNPEQNSTFKNIYAPSNRPLCICLSSKWESSKIIADISEVHSLEIIEVEKAVENALALWTAAQEKKGTPESNENLSSLESELIELGGKMKVAVEKKQTSANEITELIMQKTIRLSLLNAEKNSDCGGCLIINFPRTVQEAISLEKNLLPVTDDLDLREEIIKTIENNYESDHQERFTSSVDWMFFITQNDNDIIQNQVEELVASLSDEKTEKIASLKDECIKEVTNRLTEWSSNTNKLKAFWKKCGCCYTINVDQENDHVVIETMNILVKQVISLEDKVEWHHSNALNNGSLLTNIEKVRANDRSKMSHFDRINFELRTGERVLDLSLINELADDLHIHNRKYEDTMCTAFGKSISAIDQIVFQLHSSHTTFIENLYSTRSQQCLIDQAVARIYQDQQLSMESQMALVDDLEVCLGDIFDDIKDDQVRYLEQFKKDEGSYFRDVLPQILEFADEASSTAIKSYTTRMKIMKKYFTLLRSSSSSTDVSLKCSNLLKINIEELKVSFFSNLVEEMENNFPMLSHLYKKLKFIGTKSLKDIEKSSLISENNFDFPFQRDYCIHEDNLIMQRILRIQQFSTYLIKYVVKSRNCVLAAIEELLPRFMKQSNSSVSSCISKLKEVISTSTNDFDKANNLRCVKWNTYKPCQSLPSRVFCQKLLPISQLVLLVKSFRDSIVEIENVPCVNIQHFVQQFVTLCTQDGDCKFEYPWNDATILTSVVTSYCDFQVISGDNSNIRVFDGVKFLFSVFQGYFDEPPSTAQLLNNLSTERPMKSYVNAIEFPEIIQWLQPFFKSDLIVQVDELTSVLFSIFAINNDQILLQDFLFYFSFHSIESQNIFHRKPFTNELCSHVSPGFVKCFYLLTHWTKNTLERNYLDDASIRYLFDILPFPVPIEEAKLYSISNLWNSFPGELIAKLNIAFSIRNLYEYGLDE